MREGVVVWTEKAGLDMKASPSTHGAEIEHGRLKTCLVPIQLRRRTFISEREVVVDDQGQPARLVVLSLQPRTSALVI